MKKLSMFTLILGISMSNAVYAADETCADFIGAIKSNDIKKVFNSYMSGISDMGMVDEAEYRQRFLDAPSEGEQKHGKQWMLQRAYTKCSLSPLSTKLSDVIKVTM